MSNRRNERTEQSGNDPSRGPGAAPEQREVRGTLRLMLYVTGSSPNSVRARRNLEALVDAMSGEQVDVEIVDLTDDPQTALAQQVFLTPCLEYGRGHPLQRIVGTLDDTERLKRLFGL